MSATTPAALARAAEEWVLDGKKALYGLSVSRILVGTAFLGILVTNLGMRHALWGPGSGWADGSRAGSTFGRLNQIFSVQSPVAFTLLYVLLMLVAVAVVVGWHTRASSVVLLVGMTALVERNPLVGDQGDNIARIGLLFLCVATSSAHWSWDARRRRRAQASGRPRGVVARLHAGLPVLPAWLGSAVHNLALVALALQVVVLYLASALYKVQGDLWQGGTALAYPLALHEYAVFPALNDVLTGNGLLLTGATYFAVFVQLFFAPLLLHPLTRRVAVLSVIAMHLGIAVLMGLPWFSLSMIAFDAIFVTTATYVALGARARALLQRLRARGLPVPVAVSSAPPASAAP